MKLQKNWKNYMLASIAGLSAPKMEDKPKEEPTQMVYKPSAQRPKTIHDFDVPYGQHENDKFLNAISELESSGGKNVHHKPSNDQTHQGETAVGRFALMPKTLKDISKMFHEKDGHLRHSLGKFYKDPEVENLANMDDDQVSAEVQKNPKIQTRAARYLAEHLKGQYGNEPSKQAFGWRFGHRRPSEDITPEKLKGSGYVRKFNDIYNAPDMQHNIAPASIDTKPHQ